MDCAEEYCCYIFALPIKTLYLHRNVKSYKNYSSKIIVTWLVAYASESVKMGRGFELLNEKNTPSVCDR